MLKTLKNYITDTKYQLEFFDINKINHGSTILIIGNPSNGTVTCKNILGEMFLDKKGIVVDPLGEKYKEFTNMTQFNNVDEINIDNYLASDAEYIVFDDCFTYTFYRYVNKIINSDKTKIIITQFPYSIEQNVIRKIDYIFVQNENYYHSCKRIYDNYANYKNMFKSFEDFNKLLVEVTKDNSYLVIDNKINSIDYDKKLYYYNEIHKEKFNKNFYSVVGPLDKEIITKEKGDTNWCTII